MGTSAILTQGLGVFGSSSLVLTLGLTGFETVIQTGSAQNTLVWQSPTVVDVYGSGDFETKVYMNGSINDVF